MIKMFNVNMSKAVDKPLLDVIHSGYITQGPAVERFEELFGAFIGNPNVVAVNSCTSALTLALRLANVGPGDEVITTPMTCTATNLPILSFGAKIVWADIDPETGLVDPKSVEKLINPNTKAVMVCDWGGLPAPVLEIMDICRDWKVPVIEDAAHALGGIHNTGPVGAVADFTCFSFQAIKHLTMADGGILACRNPKQAMRAKTLRWFGIDRSAVGTDSRIDQDIEEWGYKFHMNDMNATIGIAQMESLDDILIKHVKTAQYYQSNISSRFGKPNLRGSASWLYTLRLPNKQLRDKFKNFMRAQGVEVNQVHKRNDYYTVFAPYSFIRKNNIEEFHTLKGLDQFSNTMICIPIHAGLTKKERAKVVAKANEFAELYL